jgi:Tol biopolymer transport system component
MRATRLSMTVGMAVCAMALAACEPPPVGWSTEAVSVTADGTSTGNGGVNAFAISPDGTKVAFETLANNLGSVDSNGGSDIYMRDLTTGTTTLVSTEAAGTASANGPSTSPTFSPDGSSVAFTSRATNMDPGDTDGRRTSTWRTWAPGTCTW